MRKVLLAALLCALAAGAGAQSNQDAPLVLIYDVDSDYAVGGLVFCRQEGQNGNPFAGPKVINIPIKTTAGPTTTVTSYTASAGAFSNVSAGDVLIVQNPTAAAPNAFERLVVVTKVSADEVTVDTAVTLENSGGHQFGYYTTACGTAASSGWFSISKGVQWLGISVDFEQGDITTLAVRWECRPSNSLVPMILYPGEGADCGPGGAYTAATNTCDFLAAVAGTVNGRLTVVDDAPVFGECRVGLAFKTADASDVGANREKVNVFVTVR